MRLEREGSAARGSDDRTDENHLPNGRCAAGTCRIILSLSTDIPQRRKFRCATCCRHLFVFRTVQLLVLDLRSSKFSEFIGRAFYKANMAVSSETASFSRQRQHESHQLRLTMRFCLRQHSLDVEPAGFECNFQALCGFANFEALHEKVGNASFRWSQTVKLLHQRRSRSQT